MEKFQVILLLLVHVFLYDVWGELPYEQKLHHFLMEERNYNKLVLPPGDTNNTTNSTKPLEVKLGLRLVQLLDLEEKTQILTSNVWLRHEWLDSRMQWDPEDFGGITMTFFPSKMLWRPDIVLYNNADGEFVITLLTKAVVNYNGSVVWEPPAIYKSYCPINVEFFPFDQQECFMKFGSWSYGGTEVDLRHERDEQSIRIGENLTMVQLGINLCDYSQNVEWDVINVTAKRKIKIYPCCPNEVYPDITFYIVIRRKTLFYTINLILPIITISCLTALVFYLPSDSGEKITLSISILLALTVFFLLLSDINPPTSITIPLIGKYLMFTMVVVTLSIFLTVYTLSIHYRGPSTHSMSPWTKKVFLEILPRILYMKRPPQDEIKEIKRRHSLPEMEMVEMTSIPGRNPPPNYENLRNRRENEITLDKYPAEVKDSIIGVKYIAGYMKKDAEVSAVERDWSYVAMIMDRLFLYIFTTACLCGTMGIYLYAPTLYDPRGPMKSELFNCIKLIN